MRLSAARESLHVVTVILITTGIKGIEGLDLDLEGCAVSERERENKHIYYVNVALERRLHSRMP